VREAREVIIRRLLAKLISVEEPALLLGLSARQVFQLRARDLAAGGDGLVHQNTGRPLANRITDQLRRRVAGLAAGRYAGMAAANEYVVAILSTARGDLVVRLAGGGMKAFTFPITERVVRPLRRRGR
jgi:hypothetical protein